MERRRHVIAVVATVGCLALFASSCASVDSTAEVDSQSPEYGANIATSTTIDGDGTGRRNASGSRAENLEGAIESLAENPELLANLDGLTIEQLEEATGLSAEELGTLGITPDTVGALGQLLDSVGGGSAQDPESAALASLVAGGSSALLTESGQLTSEAAGLLASMNIDPATFAALIATSMTVPEGVTDTLGAILAVVDPNGLGQFQGDSSALSLVAVILAAAIGRDPVALGQLANAGEIDPRFAAVTGFIFDLAIGLSPQLVDRINNITGILGPNVIQALGAAFALLERPAVGAVFEEAFSDPVNVALAFGSAFLSIPGLPELVAPNTFNDPTAIYGAVLGVALVTLLNHGAPGIEDYLRSLGIEVPERPTAG